MMYVYQSKTEFSVAFKILTGFTLTEMILTKLLTFNGLKLVETVTRYSLCDLESTVTKQFALSQLDGAAPSFVILTKVEKQLLYLHIARIDLLADDRQLAECHMC